jgi:beta-N-acetylhexosaminidase
MFRKLRLVGIFLLFITAVISIIWVNETIDIQENKNSGLVQSPVDEEKPSGPGQRNESSQKELINKIFNLSKEGKMIHTPFIAGATEIKAVHEHLGEPESSTRTSSGIYETFTNHFVTFGHQNHLVFDVRSYHSELEKIHLNEIKQVIGAPDEVRYYKDEEYDQIILVYQVNSTYQLKWILPNPTKSTPNPTVHHISVIAEVKKQVEKRLSIPELLEEMSLDEKIGQMIFAGISEDTTLSQNTKNLINKYKIGGIIFYSENLKTPEQAVRLLNQIKAENTQNSLPLLLGVDQEGGRISRLPGDLIKFPTNKEIGAINNGKFSFEIGTLLGRELNAFGFNLNFAPVLDVNSNPKNPIIGDRSFGSNPALVSKLGIQTMKGIQSQNIISVIKHFPGHGDTAVDSHLELPEIDNSIEELENLELIPFRHAIKNGADVVMVAHILLPKLDSDFPSSMSNTVITDILRKQLSYNGVVITDDMSMKAITNHFDIGYAAVESVKAGSDIILVARDYNNITSVIEAVKYAVVTGEINEERINESVSRIINLKRKYEIDNERVQGVNINELNHSIDNVLKGNKSQSWNLPN